uniref:Uncharacterized protein n=1 Tax=Thermodesulfobacterium geofontis TaxID=1295609 RepID=A0A7V4N3F7_9BACT
MYGRILIYYGQNVTISKDIASIISFRNGFEKIGLPLIKLFPSKNYSRIYLNFKESSIIIKNMYLNFFRKRRVWIEEFQNVAYFALNYRNHKLYGKSFDEPIPYRVLVKEVSTIIKAYYKYYSIACAILTTLFFTKVGLPKILPKVIEEVYGQDFLDDLFFAPAFVFTVFESTTDLLLGESFEDEVYIARSFLSFLLWKHAKALLKIPYFKLIHAGIKRELIWITL